MIVALLLGTFSAALEAVFLLAAVLIIWWRPARPSAARVATRLAASEWVRIATRIGGVDDVERPAGADRRAVRYLAARVPVGLLGGLVLVMLGVGLVFAGSVLWSWVFGVPWPLERDQVVDGVVIAYYSVPGVILLYLNLAGILGVARWDAAVLRRRLGPDRAAELADRVAALKVSRTEIVAAVDDERRRVERDLHDGVQQRLVSLGMALGRARRATDPARAAELLAHAHDQAGLALTELREVAWRVYPTALDGEGLAAALEQVAERAGIPVTLRAALPTEPAGHVRTVAWFVVCETVTNAAKHSGASRVEVDVWRDPVLDRLHVRVFDDGCGGADTGGSGLSGLLRRVGAAEGEFTVVSPTGGPTVIEVGLPCG